ncbi:hypothetical protein TNCT_313691 [Trichonephila clavata]|uniref:Uncharacterized protein n=1 Tax=Trichonephila clavata TaxID=2740835 RepID=A0A8X6EXT7_TRICU|nr:hypothetical protein TNCT_313691 [Trichonephila clavata]
MDRGSNEICRKSPQRPVHPRALKIIAGVKLPLKAQKPGKWLRSGFPEMDNEERAVLSHSSKGSADPSSHHPRVPFSND